MIEQIGWAIASICIAFSVGYVFVWIVSGAVERLQDWRDAE